MFAVLLTLAGCYVPGETRWERTSADLQLHLTEPYIELSEFHSDLDYFVFNIDPENPDLY